MIGLGETLGQYSIFIQVAVACCALVLSLMKIKGWINKADLEKTTHVINDILGEHCPKAHGEIKNQIDDLADTIKEHSPNGDLVEIKLLLNQVKLNTMKL